MFKIVLPLEDENLRKTPQEDEFYNERSKKIKEKNEDDKKNLNIKSMEENPDLPVIDSPEKRLILDEDEDDK